MISLINMKKLILLTLCVIMMPMFSEAQTILKNGEEIRVTESQLEYLGHTDPIRELQNRNETSAEAIAKAKKITRVPDNFNGRKGSNAIYPEKEHQGPDPLRQREVTMALQSEPLINMDGILGTGSPEDPTGDVSDRFYVQAINSTTVRVHDIEGNVIRTFAMNVVWQEVGANSAGDPIILYDESVDRWIFTEFTDPRDILVAVSDDGDPLGGFTAYRLQTPNFPDYPKYAITPDALVLTTNEEGPLNLHNYFLDLPAMYAGEEEVTLVRTQVIGNNSTEAGFYVTTPVDWNGINLPFDSRPITMRLNDSSWPNGPAQDQLEIYTFNVDFDTPSLTTCEKQSIPMTPFDGFPCSAVGFGFACIPQANGGGLDGIPELIMNIPHLRNFGTHESLVFAFITDLTNGDNIAGIRWVELRRQGATEWSLYQEGTFGPDDGLDRFMPSIAIDDEGNIGMAYNVSSSDSFVGIKYTGRRALDPLGVMTFDEIDVVDGQNTINSGGRFGDYSDMKVSPQNDNTFWFTSEYAGPTGTRTRILSFKLVPDTFDLAAFSILDPVTSDVLTDAELVTAEFRNAGLTPLQDYTVELWLDGIQIDSRVINEVILPEEIVTVIFDTPIDMSAKGDYDLEIRISHPADDSPRNNVISSRVSSIYTRNGALEVEGSPVSCESNYPFTLTLTNEGAEVITSASIEVLLNGVLFDVVEYAGTLPLSESEEIFVLLSIPDMGDNVIEYRITSINGFEDEQTSNDFGDFDVEVLNPSIDFVTLIINTDDFPEENTWVVESQTGQEIASGNTFDAEDQVVVTETICLDPEGCYTFTFFDSFGDGICCGYGAGSFSMINNEGDTLFINDGIFTSETEEEFCPSLFCALRAIVTSEPAISGIDGSITINPVGGDPPFLYSINGTDFVSDNVFLNLDAGFYTTTVMDSEGCIYEEEVLVQFLSSTDDAIEGTEIIIKPNPTRDLFELSVKDLNNEGYQLAVDVYDANGKPVYSRTIQRYDDAFVGQFSLLDYPSGVYYLGINYSEGRILRKIVKID